MSERGQTGKGAAWAVLLGILGLALTAPSASGAVDPAFTFYASAAKEGEAHAPYPAPGTGFEGPCGIGVDSKGDFYVADYYHRNVGVFTFGRTNIAQLANVGTSPNGPCALAIGSGGELYVNEFHHGILKYVPSSFPFVTYSPYGAPATIAEGEATGLAVDPLSGNLYVNQRSRIGVYEPDGNFLGAIGQGSLVDAYGLALSTHPATIGDLYVPDAATNTIKVYDPLADIENPVDEIDAADSANGGFTSLRDASVAVDRLTGELYVSDSLQPAGYERPEAVIWVFDSDGNYRGHLKHNVIDARPVGLAVDNSATGTQGHVYVTSGNSEDAFLYAYTPNAATKAPLLCAPQGACPVPAPASPSALASSAGSSAAEAPPPAPVSSPAPGSSAAIARRAPRVLLSGRLDLEGDLPACPYRKVRRPAGGGALGTCRRTLVGRGSFRASVARAGQKPYPVAGRLLLFNGRKERKRVLYGLFHARSPLAASFVIVFDLRWAAERTGRTLLRARLGKAFGEQGHLTAIRIRLARRMHHRMHHRSSRGR